MTEFSSPEPVARTPSMLRANLIPCSAWPIVFRSLRGPLLVSLTSRLIAPYSSSMYLSLGSLSSHLTYSTLFFSLSITWRFYSTEERLKQVIVCWCTELAGPSVLLPVRWPKLMVEILIPLIISTWNPQLEKTKKILCFIVCWCRHDGSWYSRNTPGYGAG